MNSQERSIWMEKIDSLCQQENWEYAQFLCMEMLYKDPNFVDVRKILQNVRQFTFPKPKLQRWIRLFVVFLQALWYLILIRKKYRELLESMDKLLNTDPNSVMLLRLFAEVMSSFGFFDTTIFYVKCIPEEKRNEDDYLLMGESFKEIGDYKMAVTISNKVLEKSPDNIKARDLLWKASVELSMGTDNV